MVSYAQNGEDVILERLFRGVSDGFFIDAGAAHPIFHSVTYHFYRRGWRGINIEPNPVACEELRDVRPLDLTLNCGLSDREGSLTFYQSPSTPCWSTEPEFLINAFGADREAIVSRVSPVTTLARICEQYVDQPIDFLKLDVEGQEQEAIAGADWTRWRPRIVLFEGSFETRSQRLIDSGYLQALFDGINHYYVREEDRGWLPLLRSSANSTDDYVLHMFAEFDSLKEARATAQSALDDSRAAVEQLQDALVSTQSALDDSRAKIAERQGALATTQWALADSRATAEQVHNTLARTQWTLADSRAAAEQLRGALATTQSVLATTQSALNDSRAAVEHLQQLFAIRLQRKLGRIKRKMIHKLETLHPSKAG